MSTKHDNDLVALLEALEDGHTISIATPNHNDAGTFRLWKASLHGILALGSLTKQSDGTWTAEGWCLGIPDRFIINGPGEETTVSAIGHEMCNALQDKGILKKHGDAMVLVPQPQETKPATSHDDDVTKAIADDPQFIGPVQPITIDPIDPNDHKSKEGNMRFDAVDTSGLDDGGQND